LSQRQVWISREKKITSQKGHFFLTFRHKKPLLQKRTQNEKNAIYKMFLEIFSSSENANRNVILIIKKFVSAFETMLILNTGCHNFKKNNYFEKGDGVHGVSHDDAVRAAGLPATRLSTLEVGEEATTTLAVLDLCVLVPINQFQMIY
jgi:hypothetical protein